MCVCVCVCVFQQNIKHLYQRREAITFNIYLQKKRCNVAERSIKSLQSKGSQLIKQRKKITHTHSSPVRNCYFLTNNFRFFWGGSHCWFLSCRFLIGLTFDYSILKLTFLRSKSSDRLVIVEYLYLSFSSLQMYTDRQTHNRTYTYIYIYIYIHVCVCVCMCMYRLHFLF